MHAYAQMSKLKDTKTHEQSTEKIAEQKLYDSDPQSMNRHKRIYRGIYIYIYTRVVQKVRGHM